MRENQPMYLLGLYASRIADDAVAPTQLNGMFRRYQTTKLRRLICIRSFAGQSRIESLAPDMCYIIAKPSTTRTASTCAKRIDPQTMSREHRTHIYTVLAMQKFARLIRWDHAGAVVTQKFDYKTHPEILGEFFWRFAHMTDEAQGYDPTAQLVSPGTTLYRLIDRTAAEKLPESFDYIRAAFHKSLNAEWHRYQLAVEDKEKGTRYFLELRGHRRRERAVRASEGLVAAGRRGDDDDDEQDEKDGHPLRTGGPHLEGDIVAYLNKMGVRNVPTVLCHGDVVGEVTTTQDVWKTIPRMPWSTARSRFDPPFKRVHYRLVEKEVDRPLSEFETSLELVKLISDCIIAHEDAMKLARVSHRDTSPGNMTMYPVEETDHEDVTERVWIGLLNEWELSKPIAKPGLADVARRADRIVRLFPQAYYAVSILNDKCRRPTIQDELESFFYVLVYCGVRYLKHTCTGVEPSSAASSRLYLQRWSIQLWTEFGQSRGGRWTPARSSCPTRTNFVF
ncbi:hypothetical protein A0H81_06295 [Grifola frondosa]|uniref:Fungal-type protein kinase domain-containing protein n=1 Tax=Grifola frondosa TaxID=5627 RepID=A0A1C7MBF8_GRIFR|nr:hypothetical protein A0H81_06295 [Grifola frondosa]